MIKILKIILIILMVNTLVNLQSLELVTLEDMEYDVKYQDINDFNLFFTIVVPIEIELFFSVNDRGYLIQVDYYNSFTSKQVLNDVFVYYPMTSEDNDLIQNREYSIAVVITNNIKTGECFSSLILVDAGGIKNNLEIMPIKSFEMEKIKK